jgi:hypothetical protein
MMTKLLRFGAAFLIVAALLIFLVYTLYLIPASQAISLKQEILAYEQRRQQLIAEKAKMEAVIATLNETLAKEIALQLSAPENSTTAPAIIPTTPDPLPPTPAPVVTRAS